MTRYSFLWRPLGRPPTALEDLDDDHLVNIEAYLRGQPNPEAPYKVKPWMVIGRDISEARWKVTHDAFCEEIERRGLERRP